MSLAYDRKLYEAGTTLVFKLYRVFLKYNRASRAGKIGIFIEEKGLEVSFS